ncbi:hypothetical protein PUN28_002113 [Cardiocondyla obscurior]|uniref:Uncharacterized protein n=1 Tax=Cardiocondyla obscurior TaxID=286306 RepID=A0AAW2GSK2_9HYME
MDNVEKEQFKKKIKTLQQKQRRTMKCVARLKDILLSLKKKNLLHTEQLDVLKDLARIANICVNITFLFTACLYVCPTKI